MGKLEKIEVSSLTLLVCIYLINCIFQNALVGDLVAPIISLFATHFIYRIFRKATIFRNSWLSILIGIACWGVTDVVWMVLDLCMGLDPSEFPILEYSYFVLNISIIATLFFYFHARFKRWNGIQLLLDVIFVAATGGILVYLFIFKGRLAGLPGLNISNAIDYISVFTDYVAICSIVIIDASVRARNIPLTLKLTVFAILVFSCTDIYYVYLYFIGRYDANSIIDGLYILSIYIFALCAIVEYEKPNIAAMHLSDAGLPENSGKRNKLRFFAAIPVALIVFTKGNAQEAFILAIIFIIHYYMSDYVQNSILNEHRLADEIKHSDELESKILERTRELQESNRILENIINLDNLTGLFNRRYFMNEIDSIINGADSRTKATVLYLDLDMFKVINDSYGHDMGDMVICEVAQRMKVSVPQESILARLGGDEMVVALKGGYSEDEAVEIAEGIIRLIEEPIIVEPYSFNISASIGIAVYPDDAVERNMLMKYADIAMYHAKGHDHKKVAVYNSGLSDQVERKHELELLLRKAKFDQEFELFYQPQISLPDFRLVGVEALIRWKCPEKGYVSPAEFIPIAEETSKIVHIGHWVLETALNQISEWNRRFEVPIRMGINISPKQIDSIHFFQDFEGLLQRYGVDPSWIDIEITERIAMKGETAMEEAFGTLSGLGVLVSIDDFGTGYSSLSYIKTFDIDRIKIAKELVDTITKDDGSLQIVKAIIKMAQAMSLATIAEGVETEDQLYRLIELGCNEVQGYLFCKPVPAEEIERRYGIPDKRMEE